MKLKDGYDPRERLPKYGEKVLGLQKNSWIGNRWEEYVFNKDIENYFIFNVVRWWHLPDIAKKETPALTPLQQEVLIASKPKRIDIVCPYCGKYFRRSKDDSVEH